jgi:hypothetical protein
MLLSGAQGGMPATAFFEAGETWRRVEIPLADLPFDLTRVGAVLFSGGTELGTFRLDVDDVELLAAESPVSGGGER